VTGDLLRRAAAELRESVKGVPAGYWKMLDGWGPADDGTMRVRRIANDDYETVLDVSYGDAELRGKAATFELIATMACPPVALALADWLEQAIEEFFTAEDIDYQWTDCPTAEAAIAVARAVLREPSDG
jgi:hypothetical protein